MNFFKILILTSIFICYAEPEFLDKSFAVNGIFKKKLGDGSILFKIIKQDAKCFISGRSLFGSFYLTENVDDYSLSSFNHKKYSLNAKNSVINSMLLQRDKKILAIGTFSYQGISHLMFIRFLANGKLDKCFGDKGIALIAVGEGASPIAAYLIERPNKEKLVIVGNASFEGDSKSFLISIDNLEKIAINKVSFFKDNSYMYTSSQYEDTLIVAGILNQNQQAQVYIDIININGEENLYYENKNFFLLPVDTNQYHVKNIAINRAKEIILVIQVNNFYGLMKINNQGISLPWGENGKEIVLLPEGVQIESIKIDIQDNIILTGFYNQQVALLKYKVNGKLDNSFGHNGIINPTLGSISIGLDAHICEDGKLLVAGMIDSQMALMRFRNPNVDSLYIKKAEFDSQNSSMYCIQGESSKLASEVLLYIDEEYLSKTQTNDNGDWSFNFKTDWLLNGFHSLKAILNDSNISVTHEFYVHNKEVIVIKNIINLKQEMFIFGTSNVAYGSVIIGSNGVCIAEAKTDAEGKWSASISQRLLKNQLVSAHLTDSEGSISASAVLAV